MREEVAPDMIGNIVAIESGYELRPFGQGLVIIDTQAQVLEIRLPIMKNKLVFPLDVETERAFRRLWERVISA